MLDLTDFGTLAHGYSNEWLCGHLGITARTLRDYKSGKRTAPKPIILLLQFMHYGELSAIGGKEWEGFSINKDHNLTVPLFHRAMPPSRIASFFYWEPEQMVRDLERAQGEAAALRAELEKEKRRKRAAIEVRIDGKTVYSAAPVDFT